jgi:hypothetical protein
MKVCNLALKTVCRTPYIDRPFPERIGSCTVGKLQRILANRRFSQHAKLNMAGFVLYLLGSFALRCRMVSVCPKIKSVLPQRTQRPRSSVIALKPTPIWDGLGCSGIHGEGGAGIASPVEVLHSRQKRPLIQDDRLKRGDDCAARRVWRSGDLVIARDPVIGKAGTPDGALG